MAFDNISITGVSELSYVNSGNLLQDAKAIIDTTREMAYSSVNYALVMRNWFLGKRISEENLQGGACRIWSERDKSAFKRTEKRIWNRI